MHIKGWQNGSTKKGAWDNDDDDDDHLSSVPKTHLVEVENHLLHSVL